MANAYFKLSKSTVQQPYRFNLHAHGQVIGTSERYQTERGRENGIEAVKRYAPTADLKDETWDNSARADGSGKRG